MCSVWSPGEFCCQSNGDVVNVEANTGFIASSVTEMTGCGDSDCPWKLTVPKGQNLNISLYDFAVTSTSKFILPVTWPDIDNSSGIYVNISQHYYLIDAKSSVTVHKIIDKYLGIKVWQLVT